MRTGMAKRRYGARKRGWPRCSQRVGGVVVAGLAWAAARRRCWCSRRRSAPVRLLRGHERRLPRPAPRGPVNLQQRRAGAARRTVFPRSSSPFYHSPLLSPSGGADTGKGQNPKAGWWDAVATPGLSIESWSRRCRGKEGKGALLLVAMAQRPTWSHTSGGRAPLASPSEGKGVYSPGRIPLDRSCAHASPRRAGQLTPSHPIPRAGRWAARRGGVGGWEGKRG
jgi:hypothetical protein